MWSIENKESNQKELKQIEVDSIGMLGHDSQFLND